MPTSPPTPAPALGGSSWACKECMGPPGLSLMPITWGAPQACFLDEGWHTPSPLGTVVMWGSPAT